jgi:phosphatidylglycerophosphatase A
MEKPRPLPERYVKPALWAAQGFGVGRIPIAPGTFGSILGVGWLAALLSLRRVELVILGTLWGAALSVWLSDVAEKALGKKDPSSVVIDEICAIPLCFISWLMLAHGNDPARLSPAGLIHNQHWVAVIVIFVLFRIFDIAKPWPANKSQKLPGGWGITVDDLLAACWVNVVVVLYIKLIQ